MVKFYCKKQKILLATLTFSSVFVLLVTEDLWAAKQRIKGEFTLDKNATLEVPTQIKVKGKLTNKGRIKLPLDRQAAFITRSSGELKNEGSIIGQADFLNQGRLDNNGQMTLAGPIRNRGQLTNNDSLSSWGEIENTSEIDNNGEFEGFGDIRNKGRIINTGDISRNVSPLSNEWATIYNEGEIYSDISYVKDTDVDQRYYNEAHRNANEDDTENLPMYNDAQKQKAAYYDLVNNLGLKTYYIRDIYEPRGLINMKVEGNKVMPLEHEYPHIDLLDGGDSEDAHYTAYNLRLNSHAKKRTYQLKVEAGDEKVWNYTTLSTPGYLKDETGNVKLGLKEAVDQNLVLEKTGKGKLVINGVHSWNNGVFNLKKGSVEIKKEGAMFGGDVNLSGGTHYILHGGAQDHYNKPNIMFHDDAQLSFIIDPNDPENNIFSFYGTMSTPGATPLEEDSVYTEGTALSDAKVHIDSGVVQIKGDCSNFKGTVDIDAGATLKVRKKEGKYEGKFFSGPIIVHQDANGNIGKVVVDTDSKIDGLNVNYGKVEIVNDSGEEKIIENSQVDANGTLEIDTTNVILNNTTVNGSLVVTEGTEAVFNDLTLDGGILDLSQGTNLENIYIGGSFVVGSGVNAIGDQKLTHIKITDRVDSNATVSRSGYAQGNIAHGLIEVIKDRNLDFWLDIDPANADPHNNCDVLEAGRIDYFQGSYLNIAGINLWQGHRPAQNVTYFQVLQLNDSDDYIPIKISDEAQADIQQNLGNDYVLEPFEKGQIMLRLLGSRVMAGVTDLTANDYNELTGQFLPLRDMHTASYTDISAIYTDVSDSLFEDLVDILADVDDDEFEHLNLNRLSNFDRITFLMRANMARKNAPIFTTRSQKMRLHTKISSAHENIRTLSSTDIKVEEHRNTFVLDADPRTVKEQCYFLPSIFVSYGKKDLEQEGQKGHQFNVLVGIKGAWLTKKSALEVMCSYDLIKTKMAEDSRKHELRSHLFTVGSRVGHYFDIEEDIRLNPYLMCDYSLAITENYALYTTHVKNKLQHIFHVSPGLDMIANWKNFYLITHARYEKRLGANPQSNVNGQRIQNVGSNARNYGEYGMTLTSKETNKAAFSVGVKRRFGATKGTYLQLNLKSRLVK